MKEMKAISIIAALLLPMAAMAQTPEEFKATYDRQVQVAGTGGLGVRPILEAWSAAYPTDTTMLEATFSYYLTKGRTLSVEVHDSRRYLGNEPTLSLKDSTGKAVNYFQVPVYDEEAFARSQSCIRQAIVLAPDNIGYRFDEIASLIDYEKESPDMAATAILELIDYNYSKRPSWWLTDRFLAPEEFDQAIMEYCSTLYNLGTPVGYESFKTISERMLRENPDDVGFIDNVGAYWQAYRKDYKKAAKFYKKALKIDPDDYPAKANLKLIDRIKSKPKKK